MFFVYILKSKKFGRLYLGFSCDLKKRLDEHNHGKTFSTKPFMPWRVVYYEAYSNKDEAIKREHNLKLRANAWNQLKRRVAGSLKSNAD